MILSSDKLEYDREKKLIRVQGNINFKSNEQFIQASNIEYDFKNKEGFIKHAYGKVNFETLNNIAKKDNLEIDKNKFKNLDKSIRNVKLQNSSVISIRNLMLVMKKNLPLEKICRKN